MFKLEISGFQSMEEVEAFIKWYEGSGEQHASIYFEELKLRGKIDRDFMPIDCGSTYPITFIENTGFMVIK
jgi:hypothetical protein